MNAEPDDLPMPLYLSEKEHRQWDAVAEWGKDPQPKKRPQWYMDALAEWERLRQLARQV